MKQLREIELKIQGLGILLYSPPLVTHIKDGEDHLTTSYMTEDQVQKYVQAGTLVGFGTGSPGTFVLRFIEGTPDDISLEREFRLRLGIRVSGRICCRDLYDLMDWTNAEPASQCLDLEDGIYRLTLASDPPASGVLGDRQLIEIVCEKVSAFPHLATTGIPHLL